MLVSQLLLLDMLVMLVSQLLLDMLVSQLLLVSLPSMPNWLAPKSDLSGLCNICAVSDFLRHTSCSRTGRWGSTGGCCLLLSQVRESQAMSRYCLQFDVIIYKTSGSLNAFYFMF